MNLLVKRTDDFDLTGDGRAAAWQSTPWVPMTSLGKDPTSYATRCKTLYSKNGIYFLVDCEDQRLSCTITEDMQPIYTELESDEFSCCS